LWLVSGVGREATPLNRGRVVHLLLARHAGRLWLLGSGPSPAFARALRCEVRDRLGQDVAEVANPQARAELVLGNRGFNHAQVWAPAGVVQAMRRHCPACVERLRQRLGPAASDLGHAPLRLPRALPSAIAPAGSAAAAAAARWGPFEWRLLTRGAGSLTTAWKHRQAQITAAWGLLWFDGAPDGSDAVPQAMGEALDALLGFAGHDDRFLGDTGPLARRDAVMRQRDYWHELWRRAQAGVAKGLTWSPARTPDVGEPAWQHDPRHALNWQRAWRLAEDELLAAPRR
jgi:hypothetical protein